MTKFSEKLSYYYKSAYDEKGRITSYQQIYESKLRWEWKYVYAKDQRTGNFQTYYQDGDNHSKKEIRTYDENERLTEVEELQLPEGGLKEKTKLYYDEQGIIKKIEYYQSFTNDNYQLVGYSDIQLTSILPIDALMAKKINEQIYSQ